MSRCSTVFCNAVMTPYYYLLPFLAIRVAQLCCRAAVTSLIWSRQVSRFHVFSHNVVCPVPCYISPLHMCNTHSSALRCQVVAACPLSPQWYLIESDVEKKFKKRIDCEWELPAPRAVKWPSAQASVSPEHAHTCTHVHKRERASNPNTVSVILIVLHCNPTIPL